MTIRSVEFITSALTWKALPPGDRPEVAFVGRSNVGKSSLLNALTNRKNLARTSGTPGKTQALNFFLANAERDGSGGFYLVDVPGYGYAKVSQKQRAKWQRLIGRYVTDRAFEGPLRAVVQLIDSRHPPTKMDKELTALLRESPAPHVVALTKGDKLSGNGRPKAVARMKKELASVGLHLPVVMTSAETGRGLDELWDWVEMFL